MTTVAIQGIRGSYSEQAATEMFGESTGIIECRSFNDAFEAVDTDTCDLAVVPLRNKIVGEIAAVADLLNRSEVEIIGELKLDIDHVLAGAHYSSLDEITSVLSHPEALRQCSTFFSTNPAISRTARTDTASSVREVVRGGIRGQAAIGSEQAVSIYGAKILQRNIADLNDNWTVFAAIKRKDK